MASRWQQWMPFHIDRYKASPAVQAMHPAARSGYLYLLSCQWQSDDCTISSDPVDLADMSGLGDEMWATYGARILRNFNAVTERSLRNDVCFEEWNEAKRVFESRQKSADRTNTARSPRPNMTVTATVTEASPSRSADTQTGTGTGTGTTNTPPPRAQEPGPGANGEFMAAVGFMQDIELASTAGDIRVMAQVIAFEAKHHGGVEGAVRHLKARTAEARSRGEPVTVFWFKDRKYAQEAGSGEDHRRAVSGRTSPAKNRVDGNRRAIAETLAARGIDGPWNTPRTDGAPIPKPRPERNVTGVHGGFGAVVPEIFPPGG